jgi:phage terminase Nu1 subunit (DNA packaging protein)
MTTKKEDAVIKGGAVYLLRPGMQVYAKTADICAMTGKSNQWVGQLTSQGTISKKSTSHGSMYDVAQTIRAYIAMLEERAEEKQNKSSDDMEKEELAENIKIKKAKAIISELEAKERQGKMHRSEDVAAITEDLIYTIRHNLLSLPGRMAVDVAASADAAECSAIIRQEVDAVMRELADYKYDPKKYEERVRERLKLDAAEVAERDDDSE